jgi:hypothetical protein
MWITTKGTNITLSVVYCLNLWNKNRTNESKIRTILNFKKTFEPHFKRRVFSSQKAGMRANLSVFISGQHQTATLLILQPGKDPEENTEAKNNGYVVFKRNICGSAGK